VNNPLDVTENYDHALDVAFHLSRLFRSVLNRACYSNICVQLMLSSPNAYLIIAKICTKCDACLLPDPMRNHIRPEDTLL
jgi:hypothetical protein